MHIVHLVEFDTAEELVAALDRIGRPTIARDPGIHGRSKIEAIRSAWPPGQILRLPIHLDDQIDLQDASHDGGEYRWALRQPITLRQFLMASLAHHLTADAVGRIECELATAGGEDDLQPGVEE